jgi:hypothetical protein
MNQQSVFADGPATGQKLSCKENRPERSQVQGVYVGVDERAPSVRAPQAMSAELYPPLVHPGPIQVPISKASGGAALAHTLGSPSNWVPGLVISGWAGHSLLFRWVSLARQTS